MRIQFVDPLRGLNARALRTIDAVGLGVCNYFQGRDNGETAGEMVEICRGCCHTAMSLSNEPGHEPGHA